MSQVGGPLIQGDASRAAICPRREEGVSRDRGTEAGLPLWDHLSDSHWQRWGMRTASARPRSMVSEVLLRCSLVDN